MSQHLRSHDITSHYCRVRCQATSHYITAHQISSRYITLLYITSPHITPHQTTSHYITSNHITLHQVTWRHVTFHHAISHYITLRYIALHYTLCDVNDDTLQCSQHLWCEQTVALQLYIDNGLPLGCKYALNLWCYHRYRPMTVELRWWRC